MHICSQIPKKKKRAPVLDVMYIGKERSFLLHSLAQDQEHDEQKNDKEKK